MKKYFLAGLFVAACLVAPQISEAGLTWVGLGNVVLNANGTGNSFYSPDSYSANNFYSPNNFNGNLGGLTIQAGQSLLLGGQLQTYPPGPYNPNRASSAFINYLVVGTSISGQISLLSSYDTGGNEVWEQTTAGNMANLDQSLANGTYTLEVSLGAVSNDGSGTVYDSGSPSGPSYGSPVDFSATFSVVPEPINLALPIFGGLILTVGLARRFVSPQALAAKI